MTELSQEYRSACMPLQFEEGSCCKETGSCLFVTLNSLAAGIDLAQNRKKFKTRATMTKTAKIRDTFMGCPYNSDILIR